MEMNVNIFRIIKILSITKLIIILKLLKLIETYKPHKIINILDRTWLKTHKIMLFRARICKFFEINYKLNI